MHFDKIDKSDFKKTNCISRKYNTQWKKFAGRNSIGDCSNLFQRLRPNSYYDFYLKYTKDGEETVSNRKEMLYYGRTEDEVEEIAKKYREECNDYSYPLEDYIKNVYMHTIIETYDGQIKEQQISQLLVNMGYAYEKPEKDEDSKYGIDFKVLKNGVLSFVLQIKPLSFFRGVNNQSLIVDRINAFHKQELVLKEYKIPTFYMIYKVDDDGNVEWLCENNKVCFELSRLCNKENGFPYTLPKEFKRF